jgi:hypothetical protein
MKKNSNIPFPIPFFVKYAYVDLILFFDRLNGYENLRKTFKEKVGYPLKLENPQSYNQKIIWKKLFDRNPLLTITADKIGVRNYLEKLLGREEAQDILVPILYTGSQPEKIPFDDLPEIFVIKPNHASMMHVIVDGDKEQKTDYIIKIFKRWLRIPQGIYRYEWAYRNIKPTILVEELLRSKDGNLPYDYKFYCFHGECKLIRVSENRFSDHEQSGYYDRDWNLVDAYNPGYKPGEKLFKKPFELYKMIELAENLSLDFDAVRVDLYNVDGRIYFGEFTHYDASGLARFEPESFDFFLGSFWNLEKGYWKR